MSKSDDGKACAVLAYILIGIVWYFADDKMKKNKFANFHVKQSLVLLLLSLAIQIVGALIPIIGIIILPIGGLAVFVLWLFGVIYAIQGQEKELPVIGVFAKKFNF